MSFTSGFLSRRIVQQRINRRTISKLHSRSILGRSHFSDERSLFPRIRLPAEQLSSRNSLPMEPPERLFSGRPRKLAVPLSQHFSPSIGPVRNHFVRRNPPRIFQSSRHSVVKCQVPILPHPIGQRQDRKPPRLHRLQTRRRSDEQFFHHFKIEISNIFRSQIEVS